MKTFNDKPIATYKSKIRWCYFKIILNILFSCYFSPLIIYSPVLTFPLWSIFFGIIILQIYKILDFRRAISFLNMVNSSLKDQFCKITNEAEQYSIKSINSQNISLESLTTIPGQYYFEFTNGDYSFKFDLNDGDHLIFFGEYKSVPGEKRSFDYLNTDKSTLNYRIERLK